jgi:hypothetical protein
MFLINERWRIDCATSGHKVTEAILEQGERRELICDIRMTGCKTSQQVASQDVTPWNDRRHSYMMKMHISTDGDRLPLVVL